MNDGGDGFRMRFVYFLSHVATKTDYLTDKEENRIGAVDSAARAMRCQIIIQNSYIVSGAFVAEIRSHFCPSLCADWTPCVPLSHSSFSR